MWPLSHNFFGLQGGDDEYEYSGNDFEDPYTAEELAEYAAASTASTAASAAVLSAPGTATTAVVIKSAEQLREEREFQYHRPDLAPFSTMINNMALRSSGLFRSAPSAQPSWADIASVSADYGKQFNSTANTAAKKLKSPAYAALEKFCGVTQEDLERRKIMKSKDLVNLKLKSFGHSIVSL